MKCKLHVMGLMAFLMVHPVFANQSPKGLATDKRVKIVAYDSNDIVSLHGSHLVSTAVFLNPQDKIVSVNVGDAIAWDIEYSPEARNVLFIKPKLPESDTNMTVLTDKRVYRFHIFTTPNDDSDSGNATYSIQFKYPEEEQAAFQDQINMMQPTLMGGVPTDATSWNFNYSFYGSTNIAPIQAVDNGTFTVFKFPKSAPIPAIFSVDRHQNESLVNFRVQGNYVFIQGVRHQYTLRNGEDVTTVYNDAVA